MTQLKWQLAALAVTFLGAVTTGAVRAQNLCTGVTFPDASQFTAAVVLSYEPGRTDETVVATYRALVERAPQTKLHLLITDFDLERYRAYRSYCGTPAARTFSRFLCQIEPILADRARVKVIPLVKPGSETYPQDYLQFYQQDGVTTLFPLQHPNETAALLGPQSMPGYADENTAETVAQSLGLLKAQFPMRSPVGTNLTMGGNVESLPGNIVVVGDDRTGRPVPTEETLTRVLDARHPGPAVRRDRLTVRAMVEVGRAADETLDRLVGLIKAMGPRVLKLDTRLTPVGHADEVFSVVRSNHACGFSVLVPSPALALRMLADLPRGNPARCIKSALNRGPDFGTDEARLAAHADNGCVGFRGATARTLLNDPELRQLNLQLDVITRNNQAAIAAALSPRCPDVDFIELPYLIQRVPGAGDGVEGVLPNAVNGLVITPHQGSSIYINNPTFVPRFDRYIRNELHLRDVDVRLVETSIFFRGQGGLHCGSSTIQTCTP